jgi:hypothetical protein
MLTREGRKKKEEEDVRLFSPPVIGTSYHRSGKKSMLPSPISQKYVVGGTADAGSLGRAWGTVTVSFLFPSLL